MISAVFFYACCLFLLISLCVTVYMALRQNRTAIYFLWVWAILFLVAILFADNNYFVTPTVAASVFCFLLLLITLKFNQSKIDVSHEETRMVLSEFNRRVDEERRALTRTLHDEVNPHLILARNLLQQLQKEFCDNKKISAVLLQTAQILDSAYEVTRDIIKNTRVEVIDSIGFTAALESLVGHYKSIIEKPVIVLDHDLPKHPAISEENALNAFKIIREALFNAIKHSKAKRISIIIRYNAPLDIYRVKISDDGVGLSSRGSSSKLSGIGLLDMRERVRVLGGHLEITKADPANSSHPGTELSFSFSAQSS